MTVEFYIILKSGDSHFLSFFLFFVAVNVDSKDT